MSGSTPPRPPTSTEQALIDTTLRLRDAAKAVLDADEPTWARDDFWNALDNLRDVIDEMENPR